MKAAVVLFLLFITFVVSQRQCNLYGTGVTGTFSTSGVYSLLRSRCNGKYNQQLTGGRFTFQVDGINDDILTRESVARVTPYQLPAQLYVFVLIDASGSQAPFVNNTSKAVKRYIRSAMGNNGYQNVSVATAFFDGAKNFTLIRDWSDVESGTDSVSSQFDTDSYVPEDTATNFYGAYLEATNFLNRKIGSIKRLEAAASGLIILASDGYDTAGSVRESDLSIQYPTAVLAGPNYNRQGLWNLFTASNVFNISSAQADDDIARYFERFSGVYNQSNQGFWLAKYCSSSRPVTRDWRALKELTDPNIRLVTVAYTNATSPVDVQWNYNATTFTKGCDIEASINGVSTLQISLAVLFLLALLL